MECLAELYTLNRQPGKALPYFLRLRRPNVFDLIRDNNLFTAVQDQALLLVEFDHELMEKRRKAGEDIDLHQSTAIALLVDHIHSIPVGVAPRMFGSTLTDCCCCRSDVSYNNFKCGRTTCTCISMPCSQKTSTLCQILRIHR